MLKTMIIGAGGIAYSHADALVKLGVKICGIYDINAESAIQFANKYDTEIINDLDDIIEQVDMVHICTPPSSRVEYARKAMSAGCHVIMEKPIAVTLEDAAEMENMAKKYNVRFMIDFNHRFRTGFKMLLDIVQSGQIGDVVNVFVYRIGMVGSKSYWRSDPELKWGMTVESLCHDLDMIQQLTGGIVDVKADVLYTIEGMSHFDNNANVLFTTIGKGIGVINASWSSYLHLSSRGVIGEKGCVILDGDDVFDFCTLKLKTKDMQYEQVTQINDRYSLSMCLSYYKANEHFIQCIKNGIDSPISGAYALQILKISHAILKSSRTHLPVTII